MAKSLAITVAREFLPSGLSDLAIRKLVRTAIEWACNKHLSPSLADPQPGATRSLMTHLNDGEWTHLNGLIQSQGAQSLPMAMAAGRLAEAGFRDIKLVKDRETVEETVNGLSTTLTAFGMKPRDEQSALYSHITRALSQEIGVPIVAAQASTGVGKTIVAQAIALDWLQGRLPIDRGDQEGSRWHTSPVQPPRVVIAFPSLNGVKTFASQWREFAALHPSGADKLPKLRTFFGRGEFVSEEALMDLLEDPSEVAPNLASEDVDLVASWLRRNQELSRERSPDPLWMMDDLLATVEGLDRDALAISSVTSPADGGVQAYKKQLLIGGEGQVIVCSHAMLCVDIAMRTRSIARSEDFRDERDALRDQYFSEQATEERNASRARNEVIRSANEIIAELALERERMLEIEFEGLGASARRLPVYSLAIIDEAHQLEQSFSNAFSSTTSLHATLQTLKRLLKGRKGAGRTELKEAVEWVSADIRILASKAKDGSETSLADPIAAAEVTLRLRSIAHWLTKAKQVKGERATEDSMWARIDHDLRTLRAALDSPTAVKVIDFSPIRFYPKIVIGSGDVRQPMNFFWASQQRALLLSATLYLRRADEWSARYQASLLHIPSHRLQEIPVVESTWLRAPIAGFYTPAPVVKSGRLWLRPPSKKDRVTPNGTIEANKLWLEEVAQVIASAWHTSSGGMLVPCTSHEMVTALTHLLRDGRICAADKVQASLVAEAAGEVDLDDDHAIEPPDMNSGSGIVVASTSFHSLRAAREHVLERAQSGERSLFLATGAAWTGLDISGSSLGLAAMDDNVLTDLVIPRLPFGMNRSLTHRKRMSIPGPVNHEVMSATILLLQALGRLVRRPGLPRNRRIFVLDARLKDPAFNGFLTPCKRAIEPYQPTSFKLDEEGGLVRAQ